MSESSLEQWLQHLETLHPREMELGLERVSRVAAALNLLKPEPPVVTVAGTNGKGSTIATLESLLAQAGKSVGCFTSPHFLRFNERIRVAGQEAASEDIVAAFEQIESARGDTSLTYFEFSTLAALLVFRAQKVEVILLEVGLGGRLDSSNIIDADIAVIASIDLDHQEWLGDTRGEIAREKAGIMRAGAPVVIVDPDPPEELLSSASEVGVSQIYLLGKDFQVESSGDKWCGWITDSSGEHQGVPEIPLGALMPANQCAALQVASLLGFYPDKAELHDVLAGVALTGRRQLETIGSYHYLLDVAHNPASVNNLLEYNALSCCNGKVIALFSAMKDKAVEEIVSLAASHFDGWFLADLPGNERAMPAHEIAEFLRQQGQGMISSSRNLTQAFRRAQSVMTDEDLMVVFGSFFTVAAVLPLLEKDRKRDSLRP